MYIRRSVQITFASHWSRLLGRHHRPPVASVAASIGTTNISPRLSCTFFMVEMDSSSMTIYNSTFSHHPSSSELIIINIFNRNTILNVKRLQTTSIPEYRVKKPSKLAPSKPKVPLKSPQLEPSFEKTPDNIRVAQPVYFNGLTSVISSVVNNSKLND